MFHVKHLSGRGQKSYKPETAFAALCVRSREKIVFCAVSASETPPVPTIQAYGLHCHLLYHQAAGFPAIRDV
jgi:hypothetical protein